jgi:ADP-ribose pyrophosphatase YjhB (NUDIX family)
MPVLTACVAVFDDDGHVLLTQREDYEVWCLPGGHVEAGEALAEAAEREVREETGLRVEITRLVGIYSRPQWRSGVHSTCFAARTVGGRLQGQPGEVVDLRFFAPDQLPDDIFAGHELIVRDAIDGVRGTAASFDSRWPFDPDLSPQAVYALRDASGLSRRDFYVRHFGPTGSTSMQRHA